MMELKQCPFCEERLELFGKDRWGGVLQDCYRHPILYNDEKHCPLSGLIFPVFWWNTRPIEDKLNERIAELEEQQRWIPVSERLPSYSERVLSHKNHSIIDGFVTGCGHWMKRPQPPKEE